PRCRSGPAVRSPPCCTRTSTSGCGIVEDDVVLTGNVGIEVLSDRAVGAPGFGVQQVGARGLRGGGGPQQAKGPAERTQNGQHPDVLPVADARGRGGNRSLPPKRRGVPRFPIFDFPTAPVDENGPVGPNFAGPLASLLSGSPLLPRSLGRLVDITMALPLLMAPPSI